MSHPRIVSFGEFELDKAGFELRKNGRALAVQPKVFDLIVYLADHRDRVVTKEELFDTVWRGVVVTDASLSQAISLARRALDDTPELQRTIRTVRGKGFRFVANVTAKPASLCPVPPESSATSVRAKPNTWSEAEAGSTALETREEESARSPDRLEVPYLYVVLHCEAPHVGGACSSLHDVDEVSIVRGSRREIVRSVASPTRTLTMILPGRLLSREHTRLSRTREGWVVLDQGSKNGTFVNGERVEKRGLKNGDLIGCGRTLIRFALTAVESTTDNDVDSRVNDTTVLATLSPSLAARGRELERVAPSNLPVLLSGEAGTGKTHTARALHHISGRSGPIFVLDATFSMDRASIERFIHENERWPSRGTLVLENLERWQPWALDGLLGALEGSEQLNGRSVRLISTSLLPREALEGALPRGLFTRLAGYFCELPPLRERAQDLGVLIAHMLAAHGAHIELEGSVGMRLLNHSWPGNIAELARCMEAAATLAAGSVVTLAHLESSLGRSPDANQNAARA